MAGFQAVWSIDVGKSSLKAIRVQRERNHLEIVAVDKVDYDIDANGIDSLHQAKEAIRTFAARNVINCPVIVSHPGHSAFSRFIQLPPVDAKKLEEMVGYEAQQQIPFPIDEVIWDYHICTDDSLGAEKEVGIFAVREEVISDFMLDYEGAGVPLSMISVGYLGLLNYMLFDVRPDKPCVVLDIGAEHTDLLVLDGTRFWVRNLGIAGNDITQALQDKFKLNYSDAEKLKQSAAKSDQAVKIFGVVQPNLKELVNEIHRSVGFYKSQAGEVKFEDLYLLGNGAKLLGVGKFLQEQLRFQVHVGKGFHRIRVNREANVALLQGHFPSFASCVGNAVQALGEGECQVNLMPKEQQAAIEFKSKQKFVLVAALLLFIPIVYLYFNIQGKMGGVETAAKSAGAAKELKANDKKIKSIESSEIEPLEAEAATLAGYTSRRLNPLKMSALVNQVFAGVPNEASVEREAVPGDAESVKNSLEVELDQLEENKFFLASFRVEQVFLQPDGSEAASGRANRGGRGARDAQPTQPAYKYTVIGMCTARASQQKSLAAVVERITKPLEAALEREFDLPEWRKERQKGWCDQQQGREVSQLFETGKNSINQEGEGISETRDLNQGTFYRFGIEWYDPVELPKAIEVAKKKKKKNKNKN